jgi:hypothetical protein
LARLSAPRCTECTEPCQSRSIASDSAAGVIRPCSPGTGMSLAPPVKNSGAPHSSFCTCAPAWQKTEAQGGAIRASARLLAAVPVATRNTAAAGASKRSRSIAAARCDSASSP